jgi:hypothetical protein
MTPARCLELLRELRSLEGMRGVLHNFLRVSQHADAWQHVLTAIDDRCALLHGVLRLDADPAVWLACEQHLAQELADVPPIAKAPAVPIITIPDPPGPRVIH